MYPPLYKSEVGNYLYAHMTGKEGEVAALDLATSAYLEASPDLKDDSTPESRVTGLKEAFISVLYGSDKLTIAESLQAIEDFDALAEVMAQTPEDIINRERVIADICIKALENKARLDRDSTDIKFEPESERLIRILSNPDLPEELGDYFAHLLKQEGTYVAYPVIYASIKDLTAGLTNKRQQAAQISN